jgi:regulator of CtrA degradation
MRLTTRLMQIASWLLLHRAVNEGEMTLSQASKEKKKVRLVSGEPVDEKTLKILPAKLADLIARSRVLQDKVRRLDATIHAPVPEHAPGPNPLDRHLGLLKAAFERTEA